MLGKLTAHLLSTNYFKMSTEAFELIYVPKCDTLQPSRSRWACSCDGTPCLREPPGLGSSLCHGRDLYEFSYKVNKVNLHPLEGKQFSKDPPDDMHLSSSKNQSMSHSRHHYICTTVVATCSALQFTVIHLLVPCLTLFVQNAKAECENGKRIVRVLCGAMWRTEDWHNTPADSPGL
ncbi:hypothetical protein Anapl_07326 [Anas platyrhynchos]|uniref:Uncharacterized protein n=1 Tax=Anas platyrhynchos TaxID=8839 RepID=R0LCE0_ANAPL|nr:hypothetical protein Anapl_07326 [Anas platyrhynchos]